MCVSERVCVYACVCVRELVYKLPLKLFVKRKSILVFNFYATLPRGAVVRPPGGGGGRRVVGRPEIRVIFI